MATRMANDAILRIRDYDQQESGIAELAGVLARQGYAAESLATVLALDDGERRFYDLLKLTEILGKQHESPVAQEAAEAALSTLHGLAGTDRPLSAEEVRLTSVAFAQIGNFRKAVEVAKEIAVPEDRFKFLQEISETLAQRGQFDQAMWSAHQIDDVAKRATTLQSLASRLLNGGKKSKAEAAARESLGLSRGLKPYEKALVELGAPRSS